MWYRIELYYACFGIKTKDDIVIEAAPIGKWMIGKNLSTIKQWVNGKKGTILGM